MWVYTNVLLNKIHDLTKKCKKSSDKEYVGLIYITATEKHKVHIQESGGQVSLCKRTRYSYCHRIMLLEYFVLTHKRICLDCRSKLIKGENK